MALWLSLLLFIGFLTTSAISYLVSRDSIRSSILENELPLSSNSIYSEVQRDLFEPILISSLMANDTFVKDWITNGEIDQGEINRYLAEIEQKYGATTAFLVSERTRRYYNRSGVLKVVSEENQADAWYFRVRKMKEAHEINVDPDLSNHATMSIFVNFRIISAAGDYIGAVGVGLEVKALKAVLQAYRTEFNRAIYFYTPAGELVLHSLGGDDAAPDQTHLDDPVARQLLQRVAQGETQVSAASVGPGGTLINYRYLPELGWLLVVEQVSDGTRGILFKTIAINLVICLLVGLVLARVIQRLALRYQQNLEAKNQVLEDHQEKLRKASVARDRLFAIIGHDLRGPVANVKSTLDLLSEGGMGMGEWERYRDDLRRGVNHTLRTLENLMEWGSLQSVGVQTRPVRIAVREATEAAIALFVLATREKEIEVLNQVPIGATVTADAQQFASILRNLLSNAIKFTPKGGRVTISAERQDEAWRIAVTDTGVGLDAARIEALMVEGSSSTKGTANEPGVGLGLLLCRDFLLQNGSKLTVKSTKGNGSEFSFVLAK